MKTTSIELRRVLPDCTYPEARGVLQYREVNQIECVRDDTNSYRYTASEWRNIPYVVVPAKEFFNNQ